MPALAADRPRNERYLDWWSLTHLVWAVALVFAVGPFWALAAMCLWEPVEVLLASPLLARLGIGFGHESLRNSLTDLVFNVAGALLGAALLPLVPGTPWLTLWPG